MNSVPFKIENLYAGFGGCEGLLHDQGDHIGFEFQIQDAITGLFKSGIKQVRVPLKELVSVTLTKGWLGSSWLGVEIVLQAARMDVLKDMPGAGQGRIELSIARKDRDAAEKFVAGLHDQESSGE